MARGCAARSQGERVAVNERLAEILVRYPEERAVHRAVRRSRSSSGVGKPRCRAARASRRAGWVGALGSARVASAWRRIFNSSIFW